eukprot:1147076-Pelagomonas_calceolata.AAC.2
MVAWAQGPVQKTCSRCWSARSTELICICGLPPTTQAEPLAQVMPWHQARGTPCKAGATKSPSTYCPIKASTPDGSCKEAEARVTAGRAHCCQAACLAVHIMEGWRAVTRLTLKCLDEKLGWPRQRAKGEALGSVPAALGLPANAHAAATPEPPAAPDPNYQATLSMPTNLLPLGVRL